MLLNSYGGYIDRGIRVRFRSPWVNHLLFADDCLIFMKADSQSATRLNDILHIYGEASGQSVNRGKSSVFFSPNTHQIREAVKILLGVPVEAFGERYLGLPTTIGRITSGTFVYMAERARAHMQGWSERLLACAAREALLKSVIQAIPTFSMACFLLTKKVCKTLTSGMAKFFWSSSIDRRSMHWISWDKLATPKCKGGMGFRDIYGFNLAMLARQAWCMLSNPDSLCARVLKGRYFLDSDFMQAAAPKSASATWKAIIAGQEAL